NVLIVDDDRDTREALADALTDAGFHVEQASSGKQALERMEKQGEPDVLLLDLRMPDMDGAQLVERMHGSRTRVIVLTGDPSARSAGPDREWWISTLPPSSRRGP